MCLCIRIGIAVALGIAISLLGESDPALLTAALITPGAMIGEIRGSIGGAVFSRNRAGAYIRNRVVPVNPSTGPQSLARSRLATAASDWTNSLSPAQREAWDLAAVNTPRTNKLGQQFTLSGSQYFTGSASLKYQAGLSPVLDGPGIFIAATAPVLASVAVDEANQEVAFDVDTDEAWVDEDDAALLVYMSRPKGEGVNFIGGPYQLAGIVLGNNAMPPMAAQTLDVPFPVEEGQRVAIKARVVRADGRYSPDFKQALSVSA